VELDILKSELSQVRDQLRVTTEQLRELPKIKEQLKHSRQLAHVATALHSGETAKLSERVRLLEEQLHVLAANAGDGCKTLSQIDRINIRLNKLEESASLVLDNRQKPEVSAAGSFSNALEPKTILEEQSVVYDAPRPVSVEDGITMSVRCSFSKPPRQQAVPAAQAVKLYTNLESEVLVPCWEQSPTFNALEEQEKAIAMLLADQPLGETGKTNWAKVGRTLGGQSGGNKGGVKGGFLKRILSSAPASPGGGGIITHSCNIAASAGSSKDNSSEGGGQHCVGAGGQDEAWKEKLATLKQMTSPPGKGGAGLWEGRIGTSSSEPTSILITLPVSPRSRSFCHALMDILSDQKQK